MEWALIIPKTLSAGIDFHFLRLCNGSCNTADPKSRYLVISLHGSRRDELKIARHWPWTWRRSEEWQRGCSAGAALRSRQHQGAEQHQGLQLEQLSPRTLNPLPNAFFLLPFSSPFYFFPLKIGEMIARRAAISKTLVFLSSAAWKRNCPKGCSILKCPPNWMHS